MKEKKWRIELTEHQLRLMAQCVEDCHRFIGGQMELSNSTVCLKHYSELSEALSKLQPLVTPLLGRGVSYGWNGGSCPDKNQRKFIAEERTLSAVGCLFGHGSTLMPKSPFLAIIIP